MSKKFGGTYVLTGLVAILAGYTFWEYKHANEELDVVKGERLAFTSKREDIDHVFLSGKAETIELKRDGDNWHMFKPVDDAAENSAVEGFLFSALTQKVRAFRTADEPRAIDWKEFGLEPAAQSLELSVKGSAQKLEVGSKNAFDGSFYVRQKGDLLLADRSLAQVMDRTASALRSRHLWREDDVDLQRVNIELGKEHYAFVKGDGKWSMEPKPKFATDPKQFEKWMNRVQDFLPNDFDKENFSDEDKAANLLTKPSAKIQIDFKDKQGASHQWVLTLGQDKGEEVYLFTNQRPTLYKTSRASADTIRVSPLYFRDGKAPFQFEVEAAREVRLNTPKNKYVIKKGDGGWHLDGAAENLELDQEKLVQLFTNLRSLEAQEFLSQAKGIKAPPQIEIRGDKGQVLFSLSWGDEYKAKSPWLNALSLRAVKTNQSTDILGVERSKVELLDNPALVKAKAKDKK